MTSKGTSTRRNFLTGGALSLAAVAAADTATANTLNPTSPKAEVDPKGLEWLGMWTNMNDHLAHEAELGRQLKWVSIKVAFENNGFNQAWSGQHP